MERIKIVFSGQVQGVGFRVFVKKIALNYNCTGYVKNLSDTSLVECELQAQTDTLNNVLNIILKGNIFIKINNYSIKTINTISNDSSFNIIN